MIRHILVVCVGNICRSPMAEALLRDALREQQDIIVESAGLGALVDHPASEYAVTLMRERGLDISRHVICEDMTVCVEARKALRDSVNMVTQYMG